jgi:hypothetical protein
MKANELRIGNYVYDTLGKVNKIDLEAITYVVKEPHNQVKPIPLTEEWLLKFGFEKDTWTNNDLIIGHWWDNGRILNLLPDEDEYEIIENPIN